MLILEKPPSLRSWFGFTMDAKRWLATGGLGSCFTSPRPVLAAMGSTARSWGRSPLRWTEGWPGRWSTGRAPASAGLLAGALLLGGAAAAGLGLRELDVARGFVFLLRGRGGRLGHAQAAEARIRRGRRGGHRRFGLGSFGGGRLSRHRNRPA